MHLLLNRLVISLFFLVIIQPAPAVGETETIKVDLELLIAMDVSHSVTHEEHAAQIEGVAIAFEHPRLVSAIRNLPTGKAAVAVMLWAGPENQLLIVPWTLIQDISDAREVADRMRRDKEPPWQGLTFTAIGDALLQGADSLTGNRFQGRRRVIDISGDDPSNQGVDVSEARDIVVLQGIVINGLPILQERREHEEKAELVNYFRDHVVGGNGHFVVPTLDFSDFPRAMLAKLISEVSGVDPDKAVQSAWQIPVSP